MYFDSMADIKTDGWWNSETFSSIDRFISSVYLFFIVDHPLYTILSSVAIYSAVLVGGGPVLEVSSNYFVIIPVLSVSLVFGFPGGLSAGACALPANLLLFHLIGHGEFSPANKVVAELSGIFVGGAFGFLADYFRKMIREMDRRKEVEKELRLSVEEKDILLRELQHRVKNNLNLIKSLIQLQLNRSNDRQFREAAGLLLNRVFAVAAAHDLLFDRYSTLPPAGDDMISVEPYLCSIIEGVSKVYPELSLHPSVRVEPPRLFLRQKTALNLGLIVNELAVNSAKHAFEGIGEPRLDIILRIEKSGCFLSVHDNGVGTISDSGAKGLGYTLIDVLAARLGGTISWISKKGLRFELSFPYPDE